MSADGGKNAMRLLSRTGVIITEIEYNRWHFGVKVTGIWPALNNRLTKWLGYGLFTLAKLK